MRIRLFWSGNLTTHRVRARRRHRESSGRGGVSRQADPLQHSALDQLSLGAAFSNSELMSQSRWDKPGKKPNERVGRFGIPPNGKSLISLQRGSPPLGTKAFLSH